MTADRMNELRKDGILVQKDKEYFIVKIGFTGGSADAEKLRKIAALADEFGNGKLQCTTRQGIDIHHVHKDRVEDLIVKMKELDLPHAISGKHLRSIVACPGSNVCRFGMGDTQALAVEIKEKFSDFSGLNCKVKLSITGCQNGCVKPQENCIGIMAQGKDRWKIFLGGKMGRNPSLSEEYKTVEGKDEVFKTINNVLNWMKDNGKDKERLSDLLLRLESTLPAF